jgi:hypothetical protein
MTFQTIISSEKEIKMKYLRRRCIDCGSDAIETTVDENRMTFRMETVLYSCGAVMKHMFSTASNTGNAIHSGCTQS